MRLSISWGIVFVGALAFTGWALHRSGIPLPRIAQFALAAPSTEFVGSSVVIPQLTGGQRASPSGSFIELYERNGNTVAWQPDNNTWILRVSGVDAMTRQPVETSIRFAVLPENNHAGVAPPAVVALQMAVDGELLSDNDVLNLFTHAYARVTYP